MVRLILFFIFPTIVFAQNNPIPFSMQEAVNFAMKNNNSALDSEKDVRLAELQKWQTTSTGLPQISAEITYNNWIQQQVFLVPAAFLGDNENDFAELVFGTRQTLNGTITLNQKIFDGSYLVALQASKVYLEISKNAKERNFTEIKKVVANAYGNILLVEKNLLIINSNIELIKKTIQDIQTVYENGLTEQENVEQLQLTLDGLKSTKNYNIVLKKLAYEMFNLVLGLNIETDVKLTESLEDLVAKSNLNKFEISNSVIENIIDYKIASNNLKSNELLLKLEKSKALPSIDAFLNGSYLGNNDSFGFFNASQKWFGASSFGINISIPVFSSFGRSAATKKARINVDKSERKLKTLRKELEIKLKTAENEFNFANQDLKLKKNSLRLAERIEKKNQTKYFEGMATSFELSQAQNQLYDAQRDYIEAMFTVLNKHVELDVLINQSIN